MELGEFMVWVGLFEAVPENHLTTTGTGSVMRTSWFIKLIMSVGCQYIQLHSDNRNRETEARWVFQL